jgi:hypothetical protein
MNRLILLILSFCVGCGSHKNINDADTAQFAIGNLNVSGQPIGHWDYYDIKKQKIKAVQYFEKDSGQYSRIEWLYCGIDICCTVYYMGDSIAKIEYNDRATLNSKFGESLYKSNCAACHTKLELGEKFGEMHPDSIIMRIRNSRPSPFATLHGFEQLSNAQLSEIISAIRDR